MAGRKTKYAPEIAKRIADLISSGCIIEDVCAKVGIAQSTYFKWLIDHSEFSEMCNRAKADANVNATLILRKAMMPHDVSSETTKTITETRLRKVRDEQGQISEVPYQYSKTERSNTLSNEFDWHAALEFLKRRDPDNWSEKLIIKIDPEHAAILKRLGLSASEAWQQLMQELASADADR